MVKSLHDNLPKIDSYARFWFLYEFVRCCDHIQRYILQPGPGLACLRSPANTHTDLHPTRYCHTYSKVIQDKEFCHVSPIPVQVSTSERGNVDYFLPHELPLFRNTKAAGDNSKMPAIHLTEVTVGRNSRKMKINTSRSEETVTPLSKSRAWLQLDVI